MLPFGVFCLFLKGNTNIRVGTWKKPFDYWEFLFLSQVLCCDTKQRQKINLGFHNILVFKGHVLN